MRFNGLQTIKSGLEPASLSPNMLPFHHIIYGSCYLRMSVHSVCRCGKKQNKPHVTFSSSDFKQETGKRQINESMRKYPHSMHLTRCSDTFIHPRGIVGSFQKEISGDLKTQKTASLA